MGKSVVLAGGSGFLGEVLCRGFLSEGWEVTVVSRHPPGWVGGRFLPWDGKTLGDWTAALEGADLLVNLAGKSVDCRYNERNKREIFDSRTESTQVLAEALLRVKVPPPLWINSSTGTIYRHSEDRAMDEGTGEIGTGFSVEVGKKWEKVFFEAKTPETRKVALRTAVVLGKGGGALAPFQKIVHWGLGGSQGNGRQMFSWIHEEDFYQAVRFIQERGLEGVVNVCAPNPVPNREWMRALRGALKVPFGLPAPRFLLEIGVLLLRSETELVLKSRWTVPTKLLQAGFQFKHPVLTEALANLF